MQVFACSAVLVAASTLAACGGSMTSTSGDAPPNGPDAAPDGSCRETSDCPNAAGGQFCIGPESPGTYALCFSGAACTTDSQCDAGTICMTSALTGGPHACGGGVGPFCQPNCAGEGSCTYWATCDDSTGHCKPLSCSQCPSYLTCTDGECGPRNCLQDGDCPGGYCVDGTCMGHLGYCGGPYG